MCPSIFLTSAPSVMNAMMRIWLQQHLDLLRPRPQDQRGAPVRALEAHPFVAGGLQQAVLIRPLVVQRAGGQQFAGSRRQPAERRPLGAGRDRSAWLYWCSQQPDQLARRTLGGEGRSPARRRARPVHAWR